MSNVIDERIVSMEFDNARFEKNINQSMRSLQSFDEEVDRASRQISDSFIDVEDGLTRFDVIAAGFYGKIGGYLADIAKKSVSWFKDVATGPISRGFDKYTARTLAAQTMVSTAGDKIAEVYGLIDEFGVKDETAVIQKTYEALDKLAEYTDATSYSQQNLNDTMSKFVMKGVGLEDAEQAMEGIGNWAAITGAGIQAANDVMPSLVKTMQSGFMDVRSWDTITRNNMADPKFYEILIGNMRLLNREVTKYERNHESIDESNIRSIAFGNNRFITDKVLLKTLKDYGDATTKLGQDAKAAAAEAKTLAEAMGAVDDAQSSEWAKTYEQIFGNYAEARKFFTFVQDSLLDIFMIGQNFRNEVLKNWHIAEDGGFRTMLDALYDFWDGLKGLVTPIGDAFHEVFGFTDTSVYTNKLIDLTRKFRQFAQSLKDTYGVATTLKTAFDAVMSGEGIDDDIADKINAIFEKVDKAGILKTAFSRLGFSDVDTSGFDMIVKAYDQSVGMFGGERISHAVSVLSNVKDIVTGVFSAFKFGLDILAEFGRLVKSVLGSFGTLLTPIVNLAGAIGSYTTKVKNAIDESGLIRTVFESIGRIINSILRPAFRAVGKVIDGIAGKIRKTKDLTTLTNIFKTIGDVIKSITNAIVDKGIVKAFGWLEEAAEKVSKKLEPLNVIFDDIKKSISGFLDNVFSTSKASNIESAVDGVTSSVGRFFTLILDKAILPALGFFVNIFTTLWGAVKELAPAFNSVKNAVSTFISKIIDVGVVKVVETLSKAISDLKDNTTPLGQVFADVKEGIDKFFASFATDEASGMASILGTVGSAFKKIAEWGGKALKPILDFIKNIASNMTFTDVLKALAAALGVLAAGEFVGFASNLNKISLTLKNFINGFAGGKKTISLIKEVAVSLAILAGAIGILTLLDTAKLTEVAHILTGTLIPSLTIAVAIMNSTTKFTAGVSNNKIVKVGMLNDFNSRLIDMALALLILAKVLQMMAKIDFNTEAAEDAFAAVIILLAGLTAFSNFTKLHDKEIANSGKGLIKLALAIGILAFIVSRFKGYTLAEIGPGLAVLAVVLTGITLAVRGMNKVSGQLKGVGANLLVASIALGVIAGVFALLSKLPVDQVLSGILAIAAISGAMLIIGVAGKIMGDSAGQLIIASVALTLVAGAFYALAQLDWGQIGRASVALLALTVAIVGLGAILGGLNINFAPMLNLFNGLVGIVLKLSEAFALFVAAIWLLGKCMDDEIPAILAHGEEVGAVFSMLIGAIISAIGEHIPNLINALVTLVDTVLSALYTNLPRWIVEVVSIVLTVIEGVLLFVDAIAAVLVRLLVSIINGLANAIRANSVEIVDALGNVAKAILKLLWEAIKAAAAELLAVGGRIGKWVAENLFGADIDDEAFERGISATKSFIRGTDKGMGEGDVYYKDGHKIVKSMAKGYSDGAKDAKGAIGKSTSAMLSEIGPNVNKGMLSSIKTINGTFGEARDAFADQNFKNGSLVSKSFIDGYDIGIDTKVPGLFATLGDQFLQGYSAVNTTSSEKGAENGTNYMSSLVNSLSSKFDLPIGKVRDLLSQMGLTEEEKTNFEEDGESIFESIAKGMSEKYDLPLDKVKEAISESTNSLTEDDISDAESTGEKIFESIAKGLSDKFNLPIDEVKKSIEQTVSPLEQKDIDAANYTGREVIEEITNGIADNFELPVDLVEEVVGELSMPLTDEDLARLRNKGASGISEFTNGIASKFNLPVEEVAKVINEIVKPLNPTETSALVRRGESVTAAIGSGISSTNAKKVALSEIDIVWDAVHQEFVRKTNSGDLAKSGENFVAGIAVGLTNSKALDNVRTASYKVAYTAQKAFDYALKIESPSRVMMESGKYFDQGFILGMEMLSGSIGDKASEMGTDAVDSLNSAIQNGPSAALGEITDPVIRPILDLSNVENGVGRLNGMFNNGYSVGFAAASNVLSSGYGFQSAPIFNMTINGSAGQDVEELANLVQYKINKELRSYNSVWA